MKKPVKIARGYRVYPETQKMILKIQKMLRSDADAAIAAACELYLIKNKKIKKEKL